MDLYFDAFNPIFMKICDFDKLPIKGVRFAKKSHTIIIDMITFLLGYIWVVAALICNKLGARLLNQSFK